MVKCCLDKEERLQPQSPLPSTPLIANTQKSTKRLTAIPQSNGQINKKPFPKQKLRKKRSWKALRGSPRARVVNEPFQWPQEIRDISLANPSLVVRRHFPPPRPTIHGKKYTIVTLRNAGVNCSFYGFLKKAFLVFFFLNCDRCVWKLWRHILCWIWICSKYCLVWLDFIVRHTLENYIIKV